MLTDTQQRILAALEKDERLSHREIMERCGLSSTSVVDHNLGVLAAARYITLPPHGVARGVRVNRERADLEAYAEMWDREAYLMGNDAAGEV